MITSALASAGGFTPFHEHASDGYQNHVDGEKACNPHTYLDRPGRVRGRPPSKKSARDGEAQRNDASDRRPRHGKHIVSEEKKDHTDDDQLGGEAE